MDGYKNLVNCKAELGDFNVLVGPNNSGKTNFLEILHLLAWLCFGDEETNKEILRGKSPRWGSNSSICHLLRHQNKPLRIGITYELNIKKTKWWADYEVIVQCGKGAGKSTGFVKETLKAKKPSKQGPAKKIYRPPR